MRTSRARRALILLAAVVALGSVAPGCASTRSAGTVRTDHLRIRGAKVDVPVNGRSTAVRMAIDNPTDRPDRLMAVTADVAGTAVIHVSDRDHEGRTLMRTRSSVPIPAGRTTYFAPGLMHVMLSDLHRPLEVGDEVHLVVRFQRAGPIAVDAHVTPIPTA